MKNKNNIPYRHINVTDIDKMDSKWRVEFEREVKSGNFTRGGKPLVLYSEGAEFAHEQWAACLALINMPVFFTDPVEMLRRHNEQYICRDTDESRKGYEEAECIFVSDFFGSNPYSAEDKDSLVWIITQALNDGVVIVIATDADEDTTGLFNYDPIAEIIEAHFEALHHGKTTKATKTKRRNK